MGDFYKENFEFNLQNVEGDNYLKNYRLSETSNIITDDNLLLSNLEISGCYLFCINDETWNMIYIK